MKKSKNWKKAACLMTMMCMLGSASACEMSFDQKDTEKTESVKVEKVSLEDRGLEVIEIMKEKIHSDTYTNMLLLDSLIETDEFQKLKQSSYDKPDKIYRLTIAEDAIENMLKIETTKDLDFGTLSSTLKDELYDQVLYTYMNMLINRSGSMALAIQGSLATDEIFVSDEKNVSCIYLYEYADQYPIAVVFGGSEDGAVLARGYFVLSDDFKAGSVEEVKKSMLIQGLAESADIYEAMGIQVEEIK